MAEDKAPGLDTFPLSFLGDLFHYPGWGGGSSDGVFRYGGDACGLDKDFYFLGTKEARFYWVNHYRLISLCTTLYKIYAKLMVERMKPILPRMIYSEQGTFIGGQNITKNVMIA